MIDEIKAAKHWVFGLIGFPLGHSFSPLLHTAALEELGLTGEYRLFPSAPGIEFEETISQLTEQIRHNQLHGLNVTIPHKQSIIPFLDRLGDTAQAILAVNTIFLDDDSLVGDNTDVDGFMSDLYRNLSFPSVGNVVLTRRIRKTALILGAGGSARSVVYGLLRDGWKVMLAARRTIQAISLLDSLNTGFDENIFELSRTGLVDVVNGKFGDVNLVVNTTPIGMWPEIHENPWPEGLIYPKNCFFYDLVYNPMETRFIKQALGKGLPATNGLGMLIEQAALSFKIWTGERVSRQILWDAIQKRISLYGR